MEIFASTKLLTITAGIVLIFAEVLSMYIEGKREDVSEKENLEKVTVFINKKDLENK